MVDFGLKMAFLVLHQKGHFKENFSRSNSCFFGFFAKLRFWADFSKTPVLGGFWGNLAKRRILGHFGDFGSARTSKWVKMDIDVRRNIFPDGAETFLETSMLED